ncbi:MAG: DUF2088 domain-containing protein [Acidobacteria bacterium]|nr:DUF2088 domain-containing protein [Acidobacteriota bacterium]
MILASEGSQDRVFSREALREALFGALDRLGPRKRVLALPPDYTRVQSQAGILTELLYEYYGPALVDVLPALGTHRPMTPGEISRMFGRTPARLFREHDWRRGVETLGTVPADFVGEVSEDRVRYAIPAEVNRLVACGGHDLVVSLGQVVPHEVIGMAGYNKNLFVGAGGADAIHKTHFLGAVFGMERILGRADTPVRRVLDYGSDHFARHLPIVYVLTVVGVGGRGEPVVRGLFIGDGPECHLRASSLAFEVNVRILDRPIRKAVVYLDPDEFKSTWLGNKAIYRTRMALADGGELLVVAPGVDRFGEDEGMDRLIRRHGYAGTERVLGEVAGGGELGRNLAAAAHLIHGSSEGRFSITYCPGGLTREEIEGAHFRYGSLEAALERYDPLSLLEGYNTLPDGEEVYFIPNPGLGLWASRERFECSGS